MRSLTIVGLLFATWTVAGQELPTRVEYVPSQGRVRVDPRIATRQMYEDIEIMRRILNGRLEVPHRLAVTQDCRVCHDSRSALRFSGASDGVKIWSGLSPHASCTRGHTASGYSGADGAYLKGHGVIFNLTLPPPRDSKPSTTKPATKPLTEWQRLRKEMRGEKMDPDDIPEARLPEEPNLVDTILKLMAENGHNFSQLGENENLTVIVNFRDTGSKPGGAAATDFFYYDPSSFSIIYPVADLVVPVAPTESTQTAPPSSPSSSRDYELLGDLHAKQGQNAEAIKAYETAVSKISNQNPSDVATLYRKLASAYLTQKQDEKAKEAMTNAVEWSKKQPGWTMSLRWSTSSPASLPFKLIISAPKKLLDQVGGGKMSFEDFKKAATVEQVTFAAGEKK